MLRHLRAGWPVAAGLIIIFIGTVVGERFGLYTRFPELDKVLHFVGGICAAWFIFSLMQVELTKLVWYHQLFLLISTTVFIGVVWEWAEYVSGLSRYTMPALYHYFHGGNMADTMGDLAADMLGGSIVALWALLKENNG